MHEVLNGGKQLLASSHKRQTPSHFTTTHDNHKTATTTIPRFSEESIHTGTSVDFDCQYVSPPESSRRSPPEDNGIEAIHFAAEIPRVASTKKGENNGSPKVTYAVYEELFTEYKAALDKITSNTIAAERKQTRLEVHSTLSSTSVF
jgi:hypothetical protein